MLNRLKELQARDWFWLEAPCLVLVLAAGAALRYWLSTALPFDESELLTLREANLPTHGLRTPFIMINGASLFFVYLLVRRSLGASGAFAVLLAIQTSLAFQDWALRIRWTSLLILLAMIGLALWRLSRPPVKLPPKGAALMFLLALLLAGKGAFIAFGLPQRLATIRATNQADPAELFESIQRAGGGLVSPLALLSGKALRFPPTRGLLQQEALLLHAQRFGPSVEAFDGSRQLPNDERLAVFDPAGVGLLLVPAGELLESVEHVVRSSSPDFPFPEDRAARGEAFSESERGRQRRR